MTKYHFPLTLDQYITVRLKYRHQLAPDEDPFAALAEMKNDMPGCFDTELLREFIGFMGPKDPRKKRRTDDTLYSTAAMS